MLRPMFNRGDVVEDVGARIQGTVIAVDVEKDVYTVQFRGFTSAYSRPMLRRV